MSRIFTLVLILAALLFPLAAGAEGNVPAAAKEIGKQLDTQLMNRLTAYKNTFGTSNSKDALRSRVLIMGTTPANINNLNQASALARQMTEEISRWLVGQGYRYDELRKGSDIRFDKNVGEFILTRDVPQLASRTGYGQVILAGTYVVSGEDVRFTMSLLATDSNEILAKASATVPITPDLEPLLVENYPAGSGSKPSVYTRLH